MPRAPKKSNKIPDRFFILKQMYKGIVNLTFTKQDGEVREMNATLVTRLIESEQIKESNPNPSDESSLIVCWDTDVKGWRSFNIETVTEYKGVVSLGNE